MVTPRDASSPFENRQVDKPRAGYFSIRLGKGHPWIPAQITEGVDPFEQDYGEFRVFIDGASTGPGNADPFKVSGMDKVWFYGREITSEAHADMLARKADRPDPTQPVDLTRMPPLF